MFIYTAYKTEDFLQKFPEKLFLHKNADVCKIMTKPKNCETTFSWIKVQLVGLKPLQSGAAYL